MNSHGCVSTEVGAAIPTTANKSAAFSIVKGEKTQDWNLGLEIASPAKGLFEIPISTLETGCLARIATPRIHGLIAGMFWISKTKDIESFSLA